MKMALVFRHMDPTEPLKQTVEEKIKKLEKYFDDNSEAHVALSKEKHHHKAEININAHGLHICGKEASEDMYNSINRVVEKIERQIKKYKERIVSSRPKAGSRMKMQFHLLESQGEPAPMPNGNSLDHRLIETKEFQARPMMLDEALMQMDLLDNDILVFLNVKTNLINVLYRKPKNKYGLIEAT